MSGAGSPSRPIDWTAQDGTRLVARLREPQTAVARPVLCLPGLTRNSRDFERLAEALATGDRPRCVAAMDYRGRGLSGYADPASYRPDVEAIDVIAGLDRLGWPSPAIVGTSRGGLITMILAASAPERVGPVVINDIGPVVDIGGLLAIRDRMRSMLAAPPADWESAVSSLRSTMGLAFTAMSDSDWHGFARQMYRDDGAGRPVLDYDPRLFDAFASFDPEVVIEPIWPLFEALAPRKILAIRGQNSDLLTEDTLAEMARRVPGMEIHRVADEGHAPLLNDGPTIERIRRFLDEADA
jgi:pimeloyl-ACP methyl ester carboxylesterase